MTFLQRFGSALNLHLPCHGIVLEGVYLDRTTPGRKPRFLKGAPSTDADSAAVVQTSSRRVLRTWRHLGYREVGLDAAVATGYEPLLDDEPALARTLAASVTPRLACGERAGQKVRRIGAGVGDEGERPTLTGPRGASVHGFSRHANTQVPAHRRDPLERLIGSTARGAVALARLAAAVNGDVVYTFTTPWSDGTTGITLSPVALLEQRAALVPLPRVPLVRYGGGVAPHSRLRGAITPTPRQPGVEGDEATPGSPRWSWARLLKRGVALALAPCLPPLGGRREARRRAAPTQSRQALRPSVVPSGSAADDRRHPPGRGDPQDAPPSDSARPTRRRLPRPVLAKQLLPGSPHATTSCVVLSATCAQWRGISPL